MRRFIQRNQILTLALMMVFAFGAGFGGGYLIQQMRGADVNVSKTPVEEQPQAAKVTVNTKIVFIRKYTQSDSVNIKEINAPDELVGANEEEVKKAFSEWTLDGFSKEKVTLSRQIDSYAPGTFVVSTSTVEEEEVLAVYEYSENGERMLKEVFDTPLAVFDEAEASKLREGIVVTGEEELARVLQNYAE